MSDHIPEILESPKKWQWVGEMGAWPEKWWKCWGGITGWKWWYETVMAVPSILYQQFTIDQQFAWFVAILNTDKSPSVSAAGWKGQEIPVVPGEQCPCVSAKFWWLFHGRTICMVELLFLALGSDTGTTFYPDPQPHSQKMCPLAPTPSLHYSHPVTSPWHLSRFLPLPTPAIYVPSVIPTVGLFIVTQQQR